MTDYCECCQQKLKKPTRSANQNRLYWGIWLKEISGYTGDEIDYLHKFFKDKFLESIREGLEPKKIMGKWITPDITTTDLSVKQFTDYLNRIERFVNIEIGQQLSRPEDIYYQALGYTKTKPAEK